MQMKWLSLLLPLLAVGLVMAQEPAPSLTPEEAGAQPERTPVRFSGVIAQVKVTDKGTVFLNFGAPYPSESITAVVLPSLQAEFEDLRADWQALTGRRAQVRGVIALHEGHPRVILRTRNQLEIESPADSQP